jgi:CheY-like chemotaxis protein
MLTCLIVTPDKPLRDVIRVGLEQLQRFEVRGADGDLARDLIEANAYDLVIADHMLGDGTEGLAFLHEVRQALPDAHLALVTHGKAGRVPARDREAVDLAAVFRAPIATAEFFNTVARMMERFAAPVTA